MMFHILFVFLLRSSTSAADKTPLTNSNIKSAVNLWISNQASAVTQYGEISDWDTSAITNMAELFQYKYNFNGDISEWDVSNVQNMRGMFQETNKFDANIGKWNTASVTNMEKMFMHANAFNADIGDWDTSSVTNMRFMFHRNPAFEGGNIGKWNTASVTTMSSMFDRAEVFNADIGNWNTSSVTDMDYMFTYAPVFNADIGKWNTSSVTTMGGIFTEATAFNNSVANWCFQGGIMGTGDIRGTSYLDYHEIPTGVCHDCAGYWADCTDVCETAENRVWIQQQAQVGNGAACPDPAVYNQSCTTGMGACVQHPAAAYLDPIIWTFAGFMKELKEDGDYVALMRDDIALRAKVWNYYFREIEIVHLPSRETLLLVDVSADVYKNTDSPNFSHYIAELEHYGSYSEGYGEHGFFKQVSFFLRFNSKGESTMLEIKIVTNVHDYNDAAIPAGGMGHNLDLFVDRNTGWEDLALWKGFFADGSEITDSNENICNDNEN